MEVGKWLTENWFVLLQSTGIIGGLLFTGISLLVDIRVRRIGNLLSITNQHQDIWEQVLRRPELARVLKSDVDLERHPITDAEELFVRMLILHLSSAFHVLRGGLVRKPDGLRQDIGQFFSKPIPKAIWERLKPFQDRRFIQFIERALIK